MSNPHPCEVVVLSFMNSDLTQDRCEFHGSTCVTPQGLPLARASRDQDVTIIMISGTDSNNICLGARVTPLFISYEGFRTNHIFPGLEVRTYDKGFSINQHKYTKDHIAWVH